MGQAALFLVASGPGVAEIDVDAVHLAGGEKLRQAGGIAVHEKYIVQTCRLGPLHGHHHGVGDLFHGNQQHVRLGGGGLRREAALAAAQLHPQLPGIGQQLPPAAPQGTGVRHQQGRAGLHPGQQFFFLSHAHSVLPPTRPGAANKNPFLYIPQDSRFCKRKKCSIWCRGRFCDRIMNMSY